jgi:hypothetical protein
VLGLEVGIGWTVGLAANLVCLELDQVLLEFAVFELVLLLFDV